MNELRDPITEWSEAIKSRLMGVSVILLLLAFVFCLIAPALEPVFRLYFRKKYILNYNYKELAEKNVRHIRPFLWIIAVIGWILVIIANLC